MNTNDDLYTRCVCNLCGANVNPFKKHDCRGQQAEALALLRELNDALVIPGWLQPRVDAVLDRADIQFAAQAKE